MPDNVQLVQKIYRFIDYIRMRDGDGPISFQEKNSFMGREENYKASIFEKAQAVLE